MNLRREAVETQCLSAWREDFPGDTMLKHVGVGKSSTRRETRGILGRSRRAHEIFGLKTSPTFLEIL
jgi:hypothetical protein